LSAKKESWIVESDGIRIRLDQYISGRIAGESRSQIQNWIRKGYLRVNGEQVKTGHLLRLKDRVELHVPETPPDLPFPEEIPIDILYEDFDIAVVNKPAGLVCHAGAGVRSGTLVNALLYHMGPLETGDSQRPGIVHRLDRFTSGVMLIAKNHEAHRNLSRQFKNRTVMKEYVALVFGKPAQPSGTIDLPLGRDPKDRKKISARARKSRSAITHYTLEEDFHSLSLLSIRIETGRTHQIRVHMAQQGHPVVGDTVYGGNRTHVFTTEQHDALKDLRRPFLHSHQVQFLHPKTGKVMLFCAPLPPELEHVLSRLRK